VQVSNVLWNKGILTEIQIEKNENAIAASTPLLNQADELYAFVQPAAM